MIDRVLVRMGFQQMFRTKKFLFALLVSLVPIVAGIVLLANDVQDSGKPGYHFDDGFTENLGFFLALGTVPFVALILAGGHLADEAEDRTLTYLLVRPVRRSTLYLSRYVPVAATAMALAVLQVVGVALLRILADLMVGGGDRVASSATDDAKTYEPALLVLRLLPTGMLILAIEAAALTALFGLVSLITTRFHFFVNLLLVLLDVSFGSIGGAGLGALAITYWVRSFLQKVDPTEAGMVPNAAIWPLGLIWLAGTVVFLLWLGTVQVRRRDFNITSAAT